MFNIPGSLIDKVRQGRVVLFLGSGALFGATLKSNKVPIGDDLARLISERFLNGGFNGESLTHIADLAISEHGIFDVQEYIRTIFEGLIPAGFHRLLPEFQWKSIFTTNYDRLIEVCYSECESPLQKLNVHLSSNDLIKTGNSTNDELSYFKLHGCITRTKDQNLPLILTVDQYNDYEKNRAGLFNYLYELAMEYSILFVGHSLQDANIRHVISLVNKEVPQGQRHYLIKPGVKDIETSFWSSKKISTLDCTFEYFMSQLESNINRTERMLYLVTPAKKHVIQERFNTKNPPSEELIRFLTNNAEYINCDLNYSHYEPSDFYKGSDLGWYPFSEDLAIQRSIFERYFEEVILKTESERVDKTELILLKGEAGAGKTVFLRQVAWKLKDVNFGCPIWIKNSDEVDIDYIREISSKSSERIFLFWDDASLNAHKMCHILSISLKEDIPLTVITAERYSDWNQRCDPLKDYVTDTYSLNSLNLTEIEALINKLEKHGCLGPNLEKKSHKERVNAFTISFERQLLVALHEATMGEPFEDIIYNEYKSIESVRAKAIYRTICTLNRLRVPVRAGLIARIFNINFEEFREKFFLPLEKIVLWNNEGNNDVSYRARHPEIAEIVFNRSFSNSIDKYHEYINILDKINISFESDKMSFRQIIRAKSLSQIFPDFSDVKGIYSHAIEVVGEDPYLLQQMANYERIRPNGNLNEAISLLMRAKEFASFDSSIYHSLATVWRDKAKLNSDPLTRIRYRGEAKEILNESIRRWGGNTYTSSTIIELAIDNFEDLLCGDDVSSRIIEEAIRGVENEIMISKQHFPDEGILSTLEARLAGIMKDDERVHSSLLKAFNDNNRDPFTAIRLSKIYLEKDDIEKASLILSSAIERRRTDHKLNFQYAEVLRQKKDVDYDMLAYYYRRSFTPGDQNYQAKFWFARCASESKDAQYINQVDDVFSELRKIRASRDEKSKIRDYKGGEETPTVMYGTIRRLNSGFGFISVDGTGKEIFYPRNESQNEIWDALRVGDRMKFNIGYAYTGLICCNASPA